MKGCNRCNLMPEYMFDFLLMLQVKLSVVDRIQPQSNNFAMGVEDKATGD